MDFGSGLLIALETTSQILTAGVAITAFALLLYALAFNLRDRVARSFALILVCVVIVFTADAIGSTNQFQSMTEVWLKVQWIGVIFLPPTYFHLSDALLATTGQPSRGRRRWAVRLTYIISLIFLGFLLWDRLMGELVLSNRPAPYLARAAGSDIFTIFYGLIMIVAWLNFARAYRRTTTHTSRRRMIYLMAGATAPAIGSYPLLLFSSGIFANHPIIFWILSVLDSALVGALVVVMAYVVAFFGVPWPDRVVKTRLLKWLLRGPLTASVVLGITTIVRRLGSMFGDPYSVYVPIVMVGSILLLEYLITIMAPVAEGWLISGKNRSDLSILRHLEDRLLTNYDLREYLEVVLAVLCDRLQSQTAFVAAFKNGEVDELVTVGKSSILDEVPITEELLQVASTTNLEKGLFRWGNYFLVPMRYPNGSANGSANGNDLLGILGVHLVQPGDLDAEQEQFLQFLSTRASQGLHDWRTQQKVLASLKELGPGVELIQELRAVGAYDSNTMWEESKQLPEANIVIWVKDALTHYWGGPKLTQSPLMKFKIVQEALKDSEGNESNALRAILKRAIDQVRPTGDRHFTAEWILFNILEMKFLEGKRVREIALRLAMSEADLYRKQRVAIEAVASALVAMEKQALQHKE